MSLVCDYCGYECDEFDTEEEECPICGGLLFGDFEDDGFMGDIEEEEEWNDDGSYRDSWEDDEWDDEEKGEGPMWSW